jgi:hypothetical protein
MKQFAKACLAIAVSLLTTNLANAQAVRLDIKAITDAAPPSKVPEIVRNGSRTEALAPTLRLEATVTGLAAGAVQTTLEWYVFGRATPQASEKARAAAQVVVMQFGKETVGPRGGQAVKTSFFAYAPGQVRDGAEGIGWMARLLSADGRVLDARGSHTQFTGLAREQARLTAFLNAKANQQPASPDEAGVPRELVDRIKADAEKNWPGNPEMQAFEIKNKLEHHRRAYAK